MVTDLRYAIRALLSRKATSVAAVLILAIAIGANTAIFGVIRALILKPLPVADAARLVVPQGLQNGTGYNGSVRDLRVWRSARSFESVAGAELRQVNLTGEGDAERLNGAAVDGGYVAVFGVSPILGRFFLPEEAMDVNARFVVLGHDLWRRRFAGSPSALGRTIQLDGVTHTVVGVMPQGFDMPSETDLWLSSSPELLPLPRHGGHILPTIARLRPQITMTQANDEMRSIAVQLANDFPDSHAGWSGRVIDLRSALFADPDGRIPRGLTLLFAGGALLLLIACANFGNLLLAMSLSRSQEVGTRMAFGAGRIGIARQYLFEGLLLAAAGACLSLPASLLAINALLRNSPVQTSAFSQSVLEAGVDSPLILFMLLVIGIAGCMAGVVPALSAARADVVKLIAGAGRASGGRRSQRFFELTVVAQIALTLVLVLASSLFVRSFQRLQNLNLGFRPDGLVTVDLALARKFPVHAQRTAFVERLVEATRALPDVEAAALSTNTPLTVTSWASRYECEGRAFDPAEVLMTSDRLVTEDYLDVIGARMIGGRGLERNDGPSTMKVAVVNEELATRCWPSQDPIGRRIRRISQALSQDWITVVGIVADVRENRQNFRGREPAWYVPYAQWNSAREARLVIRTRNPGAIAGQLRDAINHIDPTLPVSPPSRVIDEVENVLSAERLGSVVLGFFSVIAAALVALGLYSAMAGFVARQRREIVTRLAIGATPSQVLGQVVLRGMKLVLWGTLLGIACAIPVARVMSSLVFGIESTDWAFITLVGTVLVLLAGLASMAPARRVLHLDPAEALKSN